jgi:hypothetical protein
MTDAQEDCILIIVLMNVQNKFTDSISASTSTYCLHIYDQLVAQSAVTTVVVSTVWQYKEPSELRAKKEEK